MWLDKSLGITDQEETMLLSAKTAIVYGGGGSIGSAVAKSFAREGARVFLTGRTRKKLEDVASAIRTAGALAEVAELDALDRAAVDAHAARVADAAGAIDIVFNATSNDDVRGVVERCRERQAFPRRVRRLARELPAFDAPLEAECRLGRNGRAAFF